MIDTTYKKAISKNILISGIQYGGFCEGLYLHDYLNYYFKNEINLEKYNKLDRYNSLEHYLEWSKNNDIYPLIDLFLINMNGKYLNIDWENISLLLYKHRDIYLLEEYLDSEVYLEFINFCNIGISEEDILLKNIDVNKICKSKKYIISLVLFLNNNIEVEYIREFIRTLEDEYLSLFDSLLDKYNSVNNNLGLKK